MLCAPVFILTSGSSALLGHLVLWFIDLTATCHIQYTFLSLCQENRQNPRILGVCHFRMMQKWLPTVTGCAKHLKQWCLFVFLLVANLDISGP